MVRGVWRGSKGKTVAKVVPTLATGLVAILVVAVMVLTVVMVAMLMVRVVSARGGDAAAGADCGVGVGQGEESWC